jgi:hypothetical protein
MSFNGIIGSTAATERTKVELYPGYSLLEPSSAFKAKILSLDDELQTALVRQAEILLEAAKSGKQRSTTALAAGYFVEDGSDVEGDIDGEDLRLAKLTRLSDE